MPPALHSASSEVIWHGETPSIGAKQFGKSSTKKFPPAELPAVGWCWLCSALSEVSGIKLMPPTFERLYAQLSQRLAFEGGETVERGGLSFLGRLSGAAAAFDAAHLS